MQPGWRTRDRSTSRVIPTAAGNAATSLEVFRYSRNSKPRDSLVGNSLVPKARCTASPQHTYPGKEGSEAAIIELSVENKGKLAQVITAVGIKTASKIPVRRKLY